MNSDWKHFLTSSEAATSGSNGQLCALPQFGLIKVSGEDGGTILQAVLSNDINELAGQRGQMASLSTPKGRMQASFIVAPISDGFALLLDAELLQPIIMRLRMYLMRSKAVIEDGSETLACFGVIGNDGGLAADWDAGIDGDTTRLRLPGNDRHLLIATVESARTHWQTLASEMATGTASDWDRADIHAGLGRVTAATAEAFVAQMANMDVTNGVSFTKGCFPGQEIVARTHYLGKQKKRMFIGRVAGEARIGDELYCPEDRKAQAVGQVVLAASDGKSSDLLAVCQMSSRELGGVRLGSVDGPVIELTDPPYSLEPPVIDTRG